MNFTFWKCPISFKFPFSNHSVAFPSLLSFFQKILLFFFPFACQAWATPCFCPFTQLTSFFFWPFYHQTLLSLHFQRTQTDLLNKYETYTMMTSLCISTTVRENMAPQSLNWLIGSLLQLADRWEAGSLRFSKRWSLCTRNNKCDKNELLSLIKWTIFYHDADGWNLALTKISRNTNSLTENWLQRGRHLYNLVI